MTVQVFAHRAEDQMYTSTKEQNLDQILSYTTGITPCLKTYRSNFQFLIFRKGLGYQKRRYLIAFQICPSWTKAPLSSTQIAPSTQIRHLIGSCMPEYFSNSTAPPRDKHRTKTVIDYWVSLIMFTVILIWRVNLLSGSVIVRIYTVEFTQMSSLGLQ